MLEPGYTYTWENKLHIRFIYLTSNKYAKISLHTKACKQKYNWLQSFTWP